MNLPSPSWRRCWYRFCVADADAMLLRALAEAPAQCNPRLALHGLEHLFDAWKNL